MIKYTYLDYTYNNGLTYIYNKPATGHYINPAGTHRWFKCGKLHRIDGPAIIYQNGEKQWYQNGNPYRENDLPHAETNSGGKMWHHNDEWYSDFNKYVLAKTMA